MIGQAKCFGLAAGLLTAWLCCSGSLAADERKATVLGIQRSQFTINGRPTFLLGISYYGALGGSDEFWKQDLDDMQQAGCNWIRVWATWAAFGEDVSAVDGEGRPREKSMERLQSLIKECNRRDMIVDVSLSRGNGVSGSPRLQSLAPLQRAEHQGQAVHVI